MKKSSIYIKINKKSIKCILIYNSHKYIYVYIIIYEKLNLFDFL